MTNKDLNFILIQERREIINSLQRAGFSMLQIAKTIYTKDATPKTLELQAKIVETRDKCWLPLLNDSFSQTQLDDIKAQVENLETIIEEVERTPVLKKRQTKGGLTMKDKVVVKKEVAPKVKKEKGAKVVKASRELRDEQNGITRPYNKTSATGRVWDICDKIYAKKGAVPTVGEVRGVYMKDEGASEGTVSVQRTKWCIYMGLPSKSVKEEAPVVKKVAKAKKA